VTRRSVLAETLDGWMTAEIHAKRSREALEKLADINPLHVEAGVWSARDAVTNFRISEGLRTLDKVATVAPKHPGLLTLRAVREVFDGRRTALAAAFAPVFEVDPTYGEAFRVLADVLNQRRRWPESLRFAEEAVKRDPEDPRIRDDVARYALFLGEGEKGLAALKAADERDAFGQPWRINMRKLLSKMSKSFTTVKAGRFDVRLPTKDADLLSRVYGPFIERSYGILKAKYWSRPGRRRDHARPDVARDLHESRRLLRAHARVQRTRGARRTASARSSPLDAPQAATRRRNRLGPRLPP
jgi:tetratricopeptide (TPR) repeat protein